MGRTEVDDEVARHPGAWSILGWFLYPIVPVLLASSYYAVANFGGTDPRQWGTWGFVLVLGPLGGYAYLAGATIGLPDDVRRRGWRSLASRRAVWVAVGPWIGFLATLGWIYFWQAIDWALSHLLSPERLEAWRRVIFVGQLPNRLGEAVLIGGWGYGWLLVAFAAARRARRRGQLLRSLRRGVLTAAGFLGTLVGGFWAATSAFRAYFFDPRIMPVWLVAGLAVFFLSGCGATPTIGDIRRRELFQAMTLAWVLGLALIWRWLSRSKA